MGGKYDRTLLIESVLEPSRQILDGYRLTAVATRAGQVFSGIVKQESDKEVTLVDAQGLRQVIRKSEIEQRTAGDTSLMPDGVTAGLSQNDVADLIAFLTILRSAAQGTPGSGVTGPISLPPGFSSERLAAGITGATALAVAPDGRILVCEQTGALRVVKCETLLPRPFATVNVDSTWERRIDRRRHRPALRK